ncbi:nuclear transport factor 2 family protein [Chitinivorax sp. B]|uniref:nuclear transport factor 2 family protein n=1 Tax=Chitinivorax sp. B TaxID=2502235 RepID=UPI0010F862BA|nr:nuclear transport factor 2 family protein [Chitinivorax sp. B]
MIKHALTVLALSVLALPSPMYAKQPDQVAGQHQDFQVALHEVLEASRAWIAAFNAGNARACAEAYLDHATMEAKPFGSYVGRQAILAFWTDLIGKGARNLAYTHIKIEQPDVNTMLLSADWSMNIGGGHISRERWVKQGGRWMLAEDRFEVLHQN